MLCSLAILSVYSIHYSLAQKKLFRLQLRKLPTV